MPLALTKSRIIASDIGPRSAALKSAVRGRRDLPLPRDGEAPPQSLASRFPETVRASGANHDLRERRVIPPARSRSVSSSPNLHPSRVPRARPGLIFTVLSERSPAQCASTAIPRRPFWRTASSASAKGSMMSGRMTHTGAFQSASSLSKPHPQAPSSEISARTGRCFAQGNREGRPTSRCRPNLATSEAAAESASRSLASASIETHRHIVWSLVAPHGDVSARSAGRRRRSARRRPVTSRCGFRRT